MSRSTRSASGSPYVLAIPEYDGPEFDNPEKPIFSVATPAGERFDAAWLEQVPPEGAVEWLWPGTIPLRKVTLLEGPAGAGKSQLALDLAARVTGSAPWPSGQPSSLPTADVLVVCRKNEAAEASARFQRAGGDLAKLFHFCEFQTFLPADKTRDIRPIAFPYDFPALEHHVEMHESFGVIIIDSLADFCRTPRELAETIVLLEELASRANVALIVTVPANCRVDAQGRLRVTSRWPTDTVRSAWCVLPDPDNPLRRLFVAKRTNFCLEPDGLAYRLSDCGVVWEAQSRISPVDPVGQFRAIDVCLAELLSDAPLPASTVYRLGGEMGFSPKQLRTAGERLGVACQRIGFSGKGHWSWSLPGPRPEGDRPNVGCVEQAQATVRRRSPENGSNFEGVLPAPEAACADTPDTRASLTHPTRLPVARQAAGGLEVACVEPVEALADASGDQHESPARERGMTGGGNKENEESLGIYGESMGNGVLADASADDHVEQVSNLLVPTPASSANRGVDEKSEPRMARVDTNDGRGNPDTDDAERGDESAQPVCVPSDRVEHPETFDGTRSVPTTLCGNESERSSGGNAYQRAESRRRRRKSKRNRKKEWKDGLAIGEVVAVH